MKMSQLYVPTLREDPVDSEVASHRLLMRSGMIRKKAPGLFSYLPLGVCGMEKLENTLKEALSAAGQARVSLTGMEDVELIERAGTWQRDERHYWGVRDSHGQNLVLSNGQEAAFADLVKGEIKSYKKLPIRLYQIEKNYYQRNKPRFGFIRGREFVALDGFSYDLDDEGLHTSYEEMKSILEKALETWDVEYAVVEGRKDDDGNVLVEQLVALCEDGEDVVYACDSCGFHGTPENTTVIYEDLNEDDEMGEIEKVHTPETKTIADLTSYLKVDHKVCGKALMYNLHGELIILFVPGDRDLSEEKLAEHLGCDLDDLELADDYIIMEKGASPGFTGPLDLADDVRLIVDERITRMKNLVVGANEDDYHLLNVNYGRDFKAEVADDLLEPIAGDVCPNCGEGKLQPVKGIRLGVLRKHRDELSKVLNVTFLDQDGKEQPMFMGAYHFNLSKALASIVEQHHDDNGILWPVNVAPFEVIITIINPNKEEQAELGHKLYEELRAAGVEVLLDDRNDRAGVKFNDRDLIGIPIQITVGKKAGEQIVEFALRSEDGRDDILADEIVEKVKGLLD